MPKIIVKIDLEKDAWNWWDACNSKSYGVDWKEKISKRLQDKIVNRNKKQAYKFLFPYLRRLHKKINLEAERRYTQREFNKKQNQLFKIMEEVTGKKICRENFTCFMTTFPRAPYRLNQGYIWLYYKWGRGDYIDSFTHELLHFQTYAYWYEKCLKKLSHNEFENLKEALTVVLNNNFKKLMFKPDHGYYIHQYLRQELMKHWQKNKDFNKLINYGIKIYPRFKDTIKYLLFGKYTEPCPEYLIKKIKKIKAKKFNKKYVQKILNIILDEFNPKKYKITITKSFKQSRFTPVETVLKRHQKSCGSMATVVASVFRRLGIPTKLVDGNFIMEGPTMQHAWNEIYNPSLKKFIPFDITREDFKLGKYHIRKGEYMDWSELEK